ncbi:Agouti-signaling protein, partial [Phaethon lepturus]
KIDLILCCAILFQDLTKRSQKVSRKEAENKKSSKTSPKPRPTPAADCVPNFKTCKPHLNSCCNYCALCKCRIFQTICQCLMLNPKC